MSRRCPAQEFQVSRGISRFLMGEVPLQGFRCMVWGLELQVDGGRFRGSGTPWDQTNTGLRLGFGVQGLELGFGA